MMKKTNYSLMEGALFHVLNFMIVELMRQGFIVAMENELSDLKGLVNVNGAFWLYTNDEAGNWDERDNPDAGLEEWVVYAEVEFELLDGLENEVVKQIMITVKRLIAFRDRHLMLTGLDVEELLLDEDCYFEGSEIFFCYLDDFTVAADHDARMSRLDMVYIEFFTVLYYCALSFTYPDADVSELMEEIAVNDPMRFWEGELETGDQNALRMLELHEELQGDHVAIGNLI